MKKIYLANKAHRPIISMIKCKFVEGFLTEHGWSDGNSPAWNMGQLCTKSPIWFFASGLGAAAYDSEDSISEIVPHFLLSTDKEMSFLYVYD